MENAKHIGTLIEKARKDRGVTRAWMAKQLGISYSTLDGIEKGRYGLSAERAAKIADILHMTLDELLRPQVGETLSKTKTGTDA